jgi:outer membrane protein TolC
MQQSFSFFPKIKEVENAEITAQEKLNLIELNKNPQFDVNASYNFVMPKISFPINGREIQFAPTSNVATSIGAVYPIYDFGRLKTNIDKAKIDLSLSKHTTTSSKIQLAYQVANIYYTIIYLQKALAIQDSILVYFNENKKIIDKKIFSGEALKIDALNLQANIDAEENKRIDLLKQYI